MNRSITDIVVNKFSEQQSSNNSKAVKCRENTS